MTESEKHGVQSLFHSSYNRFPLFPFVFFPNIILSNDIKFPFLVKHQYSAGESLLEHSRIGTEYRISSKYDTRVPRTIFEGVLYLEGSKYPISCPFLIQFTLRKWGKYYIKR